MEIVEGIHRVDEASGSIAHSNVYLIIDGPSLLIIDTGLPGNAKKIVEYIQKIGRQPNEVAYNYHNPLPRGPHRKPQRTPNTYESQGSRPS